MHAGRALHNTGGAFVWEHCRASPRTYHEPVTCLGAAARHDLEPAPTPVGMSRQELVDGMAQATRELEAVQREALMDRRETFTPDEESRWDHWMSQWRRYETLVSCMDNGVPLPGPEA
jgi:hypothetical protein